MSDPHPSQRESSAEESSSARANPIAAAPAQRNQIQRGGLRGCFDGRQSLALTFWLLGVGLFALLTVAGKWLTSDLPLAAFPAVTLITMVAIGAARVAAWYAIVACRRNTRSEVFTALALISVALDIVFSVFRLPTLLMAMSIT